MPKSFRVVTKDAEGVEKVVIVRKPNHSQLTEAQFYSAKIFNKAKDSGACLRSKLNEFLIKQGVWSEDNQKELEKLNKEIVDKLGWLESGKKDGKKLKLTEGKQLAVEIRNARIDVNVLLAKLRENDSYTLEGQAENARFDALVSLCCFDEEGNRLFSSVEDYYDKREEEYAVRAASKVASIVFDLKEDWEKDLPENKFLMKYKFVNEELRYIDRQGRLTTADGRLIDKDGNLLDESGNVIKEETVVAEFENDVD